MDGFQRELLARMPLAQAVLLLFSHTLDQTYLDRLFEENRGRCYEGKLPFATVVYLIRDALVLHEGSGRGSFQRAQAEDRLPSSIRAVYRKLSRIPLSLSMALLRDATARLQPLLPSVRQPLPQSLAHLQAIVFDGKTIKHVAAQLKALRNRRGRINSGKMLVALDLHSGLALALQPSANSEANDVSLVDGLLQQLGAGRPDSRLFIADRQFSDLPRLAAFTAHGQHFLIRHNRNLYFYPDAQRPAGEGINDQGDRFVQEWGWLGSAALSRRYVRRVTVYRPGEEDVAVLSDLLDERRYPAQDLLKAYLQRWGIERVFQQVTEVFDLKNLIGTMPNATLFQSSLCLLLYNLIQVVRAYVAQAGGQAVEEVSTEKLFEDCQMELISWATVGEPQAAIELLAAKLSTEQLKQKLQRLLGELWQDRWLRSPPQKNHGKTPKTIYPKKGYTNLWKLLQEQHPLREPRQQHA